MCSLGTVEGGPVNGQLKAIVDKINVAATHSDEGSTLDKSLWGAPAVRECGIALVSLDALLGLATWRLRFVRHNEAYTPGRQAEPSPMQGKKSEYSRLTRHRLFVADESSAALSQQGARNFVRYRP